jgi:hypothetical protein
MEKQMDKDINIYFFFQFYFRQETYVARENWQRICAESFKWFNRKEMSYLTHVLL